MARQIPDKEALHLYQLIGAPLLAVVEAEVKAAQASVEFIRRIGFEKPVSSRLPSARPPLLPATSSGTETGNQSTATAKQSNDDDLLQNGGDLGKLKVISFAHSAQDRNGERHTFETSVPVLSLFPLPLLQIKSSEFDFGVRIIECVSSVPVDSFQQERKVPIEMKSGETDAKNNADSKSNSDDIDYDADFLSRRRPHMKAALASSTYSQRRTDMQMKIKVRMEQADIPAGLAKLLHLMDQSIQSVRKDQQG